MTTFPSEDKIKHVAETETSFGNRILYKMCEDYPRNNDPEIVKSKLWLIGRSYAAALERSQKPLPTPRDNLYDAVAQDIITSLDESIQRLREKDLPHIITKDTETVNQIFSLHREFTEILQKHTGIEKRSLASKYLHFHLPKYVFIYDSVIKKELREIYPRTRIKWNYLGKHDIEYTNLVLKLLRLRDEINERFGIILLPNQLDRLLY